jgi:hypothetical protein
LVAHIVRSPLGEQATHAPFRHTGVPPEQAPASTVSYTPIASQNSGVFPAHIVGVEFGVQRPGAPSLASSTLGLSLWASSPLSSAGGVTTTVASPSSPASRPASVFAPEPPPPSSPLETPPLLEEPEDPDEPELDVFATSTRLSMLQPAPTTAAMPRATHAIRRLTTHLPSEGRRTRSKESVEARETCATARTAP